MTVGQSICERCNLRSTEDFRQTALSYLSANFRSHALQAHQSGADCQIRTRIKRHGCSKKGSTSLVSRAHLLALGTIRWHADSICQFRNHEEVAAGNDELSL